MKKTAIVFMLIIAVVFLAGCTTNGTAGQETARDTIRAHYDYQESWSPGPGCYGKVTGYAYNAGNTTVDNVAVNFNLVNTRTGTIRDSRIRLHRHDGGRTVRYVRDGSRWRLFAGVPGRRDDPGIIHHRFFPYCSRVFSSFLVPVLFVPVSYPKPVSDDRYA